MDIIKKINYILDRKQKIHVTVLAVMIFIGGLLETMSVSALLPVVWVIIDPVKAGENSVVKKCMELFGVSDVQSLMIPFLVLLIFMYVFKNAFLMLLVNEQNRFIAFNRNKIISVVLREFLNRPYEFYLDADIPTVFRLTDHDIPQVFNMMLALISMATEGVVFVMLSVVLFVTNWQMLLFLIAVFGVITLFILLVFKPYAARLGEQNLKVQSRIAKWRIQAIYGIKDVKVLHRESFFADNYESSGKVGATLSRKYAVINALPRLVIETIFIAGVLLFLILQISVGKDVTTMIPMFTVFGIAAVRLMPSVNRINSALTEIAYDKPSLDYVYENMNINEISRNANRERLEAVDSSIDMILRKEIVLKDITYAYPNTEKNIFTKADMVIPCGKSVGIMGPSGAGKSTIVDILLGLLKVHEGTITCDGQNVFDNYPAWLANIGYIPQTIYLVDEPIRNNIAFGIADEEIDDERVWTVLEEAQLKEFVESLPEQLDTTIGDRGVRMSGGQRQRLGIARALYHNPSILVFDEATSALDNETEKAVMDAVNNFHGKKTMVIIAHRLNTIEKCDIIYKVDEEKITETTLA